MAGERGLEELPPTLGAKDAPKVGHLVQGSFAQVAEWLMAADCKSAAPWSYGGSNPPLCTRIERKLLALAFSFGGIIGTEG